MKAIILAAGRGERLRPLTDRCPKVLLPIAGRPLLDYWLEICAKGGVTEVLINGHYKAEMVEQFANEARARYPFKVNFVKEDRLYGTGGTILNNRHFVESEEFFFWCHGDNFTDIDLTAFVNFHMQREAELSVALFETNVPRQCGIAEEIEPDGLITRFVEKPDAPKSNLASAAIFLMNPNVLRSFPDKEEIDFSREVLPLYQGNMYGYRFEGENIDVGTPANYERANERASALQAKQE